MPRLPHDAVGAGGVDAAENRAEVVRILVPSSTTISGAPTAPVTRSSTLTVALPCTSATTP
jgi:hypothetical protein